MGRHADENNEMPTRTKSGLKPWMLIYAAFVIALASAGSADDSSATSVSPGTYPSETTADKVFFTPTIERPRRSDI